MVEFNSLSAVIGILIFQKYFVYSELIENIIRPQNEHCGQLNLKVVDTGPRWVKITWNLPPVNCSGTHKISIPWAVGAVWEDHLVCEISEAVCYTPTKLRVDCPKGLCEMSTTTDWPHNRFAPKSFLVPCTKYTVTLTRDGYHQTREFRTKEEIPGAPRVGMQQVAPAYNDSLTVSWSTGGFTNCIYKYRISWMVLGHTDGNSVPFIQSSNHKDVARNSAPIARIVLEPPSRRGLQQLIQPQQLGNQLPKSSGSLRFTYTVSVQAITQGGILGEAKVISGPLSNGGGYIPDPSDDA